MSRKPNPHIDPAELDAALAALRQKILAASDVDIRCEQGRVEKLTYGPYREFEPGAQRITITIDGFKGGLGGKGDMSADERSRLMVLYAGSKAV